MQSTPILVSGYKNTYYIRYQKSDGKYTQFSTKTKNKVEARKELVKFIKSFDPSSEVVNRKVRIGEFALKIEELCKESNRSFKRELYMFKPFIQYFGENRWIDTITSLDIENYKNWRRSCKSGNNIDKMISVASVNKELRTLKAEFNRGVNLGIINKNPFLKIQYIKVTKLGKLVMTDEEIRQIVEGVQDSTIKNVVVFGVLTGCRLGEITSLTWECVDLQNRVIHIRNKVDKLNNVIFRTKTNENRDIPINDTLLQMLVEMKQLGGYVFSKRDGLKLENDYVSKYFKSVVRELGLNERLHFHCLRHTFITNLIKKGVSIYFVKELAGHKNISTTIGYTHIDTNDLRNSVNLLSV